MSREIPQKLLDFLKNALKDVDDGYEYYSELHRILNSDDCQHSLKTREIDILRDFADKVKGIGEIDYYTEERFKEIEREHFGHRGIMGFLDGNHEAKPNWPF